MKKELNNLIQLLRTDKILKFDQCVEENDLVILYCKLDNLIKNLDHLKSCLLYTSPSPRDA